MVSAKDSCALVGQRANNALSLSKYNYKYKYKYQKIQIQQEKNNSHTVSAKTVVT